MQHRPIPALTAVGLVILGFSIPLVQAQPPFLSKQVFSADVQAARRTAGCSPGSATALLEGGNVLAPQLNSGVLSGGSLGEAGQAYEVPAGSGDHPLFTSVIWVGGFVGEELRVAAATYAQFGEDYEFFPGPLDTSGNPPDDCTAYDHLYHVSREDIAAYEATGQAPADLLDWPYALGAPVIDGDGIAGNYALAGGDRPELVGDEAVWWVMNDVGGEHLTTHSLPIGLQISVLAYAYREGTETLQNSTFYRIRLRYRPQQEVPLRKAYFGVWSDFDLGNPNDDYAGSDSVRSLGYTYDGGDSPQGGYVPAFGWVVLSGPLLDQDGVDNDADGQIDEGGERLNMTGFVEYDCQSSRQLPCSPMEFYNNLLPTGLNGEPITVGGDGFSGTVPTRYMYSGNPPGYWSEDRITHAGGRNRPGDRKQLVSIGPFDLQPGEEQELTLALVWAKGWYRFDAVAALKRAVDELLGRIPDSPPAPPDTAPDLLAPADGVADQPANSTLNWSPVEGADVYRVQVSGEDRFLSPSIDLPVTTRLAVTLPLIDDNDPQTLYWRIQAGTTGGTGPWSASFSFTTSGKSIRTGGVWTFPHTEIPVFVEMSAPGGTDPCPEGSTNIGCIEADGFAVSPGQPNSTRQYALADRDGLLVYYLAHFAPHDYEIRFTTEGSYAWTFTGSRFIQVSFEIWDVGNEAPFKPNDPFNDVRLIPAIAFPDENDCLVEYQDEPNETNPVTPLISAYYPKTSYADVIDRFVRTGTPDLTCNGDAITVGEGFVDHLDWGRRPIRRLVIADITGTGRLSDLEGTVIRLYTTSYGVMAPILSAPRDGATDVTAPFSFYWSTAPSIWKNRIQVAVDPVFRVIVLDSTVYETNRLDGIRLPTGVYHWRVKSWGLVEAESDWSTAFDLNVASSTPVEPSDIPVNFFVGANYPNPFNPSTQVNFGLPSAEEVTLTVYNVLGQKVGIGTRALYPAGRHTLTIDAGALSSGIYFFVLEAGPYRAVRKMTLVR